MDRLKTLFLGLLLLLRAGLVAEEPPVLRISVENSAEHIQTRIVHEFADRVESQSGGRLKVEVYDGARLFRDKDVVAAIVQGKVEMACPGIWIVETFDPSLGLLLLPRLLGAPAESYHRLADSWLGESVADRLLESYGIVVLGGWLDLGHAHLFTVGRRVRTYEEIRGLRIRVAGGKGNELRIEALGARAQSIAWPDFPAYLARGAVDGVLTTYETIASARLWEKGLRYVFEDAEYFPMYIPLLNEAFFDNLPPDIRELLGREWAGLLEAARTSAAEAQAEAKKTCLDHGMIVTVPTVKATEEVRRELLAKEPDFVRRLGIPLDSYRTFLRFVSR